MPRPALLRACGLALLVGAAGFAQGATPYRTPSPALTALVDAPPAPLASLAPDRSQLLLLERPESPSIAELAQPELRIAGQRINPANNGQSRALTFTALVFQPMDGGASRRATGLPAGARIGDYEWSRDSRHVALTVLREKGIELWLVDVARATARRLTGPIVNAVFGAPVAWLDNATLLLRRVPDGRGGPPAMPSVPPGPVVQENLGRRAAARTYEDLIASPHDEALFDYYATAELATVTLDGAIERFAPKAIYTRAVPSPDGRYVLAESLHRPYSYLVPSSRFPTKAEVLTRGRSVHVVADLPLNESMAGGGVRPGPRTIAWRADVPATLSWTQSLDGGAPDSRQPQRDAWFTNAAPFAAPPVEQQRFELRVQSITWGDDSLALVTESLQRTRQTRTWRVNPGRPGSPRELLFQRSSQDRYANPGTPVLARNALGRLVLQRSTDGGKLYFEGAGASPEGDRPFLDEFDLATKQSTRLWRSAPPQHEEFVAFLDRSSARMLIRRESVDDPGGYFVGTPGSDSLRPVVTFPHPHPHLAGFKGELIRYQRDDGVALSGTLYLPPGYEPEQGPLPTLLWAYPREHLSADTAGQVNVAPHRFVRVNVTGPLPFVLAGYAVLSDPAMPIIGRDGKPPNDSYREQLVAGAKAAVDELVRRGVSDPKRIAVGGHSYGAFMTANLLAHTNLFRAGIARSGAYNRTLTPFGFQNEQRTLWTAPEVYAAMSPFNFADKIKTPILLIHGDADNNSGTFPIQTARFYHALKGHGATARYVILPHESHSYRARESVLHMLWEMETWLDTYVKPPPQEARKTE